MALQDRKDLALELHLDFLLKIKLQALFFHLAIDCDHVHRCILNILNFFSFLIITAFVIFIHVFIVFSVFLRLTNKLFKEI